MIWITVDHQHEQKLIELVKSVHALMVKKAQYGAFITMWWPQQRAPIRFFLEDDVSNPLLAIAGAEIWRLQFSRSLQ